MTWGQNERNKTLKQNDTPVSVPFGDYFSFPESRPANFLSNGSSATASNILTGLRATDFTAQPATPAGPYRKAVNKTSFPANFRPGFTLCPACCQE